MVVAKPTVHFSLTFDHRVVDGADAALFLNTLVTLLGETGWLGL
jgi:pyruvate/2-oxoglutarate dehydrogenase complex dihydrolipoamide acyltransferase (E2) component